MVLLSPVSGFIIPTIRSSYYSFHTYVMRTCIKTFVTMEKILKKVFMTINGSKLISLASSQALNNCQQCAIMCVNRKWNMSGSSTGHADTNKNKKYSVPLRLHSFSPNYCRIIYITKHLAQYTHHDLQVTNALYVCAFLKKLHTIE